MWFCQFFHRTQKVFRLGQKAKNKWNQQFYLITLSNQNCIGLSPAIWTALFAHFCDFKDMFFSSLHSFSLPKNSTYPFLALGSRLPQCSHSLLAFGIAWNISPHLALIFFLSLTKIWLLCSSHFQLGPIMSEIPTGNKTAQTSGLKGNISCSF